MREDFEISVIKKLNSVKNTDVALIGRPMGGRYKLYSVPMSKLKVIGSGGSDSDSSDDDDLFSGEWGNVPGGIEYIGGNVYVPNGSIYEKGYDVLNSNDSVTKLNDVEDAGSGQIITSTERDNLDSAYNHVSNTSNPHQTGFSNAEDYDITDAFFTINEGNDEQDAGMRVHVGSSNYQLFKWDKENQRWLLDADVHVEGAVTATEEIAAYSDTATDSIWDDMPVATSGSLGGVKVDDSVSDVYLDANNVLQIDVPDDVGQWDNTDDGIEYNDGDVDIPNGSLTVGNNVTIQGDLTVNGTEFIANTETVEIEDNLAIINSGETGDGVTAGFAGWEVDRGTYTNYRWGFDEGTDTFRLGEEGDLQAVATRPDNPDDDTMALWDDSNNRLKFVERSNIDIGEFNDDGTYLSSIPTLQEVTEQGNTTTENITVNDLTADGVLQVDGTGKSYVMGDFGVGINSWTTDFDPELNISGGKPGLKLYDTNDDTYSRVYFNAGSLIIGVDEENQLSNPLIRFYGGGSEWMRLRNGRLGIGITNPAEALDVDGNIVASGEIEAYSSSDKFLKYNIQGFTASDLIEKLNPVKFSWNDIAKELNSRKTDGLHYGLIAQEVEEVMPEIVKNMYGGKYLGLDYEQLIPVLVQALKEQQKEIENLKNI